MRMILPIVFAAPYVIALFLAIAGAVVALIGAMGGFADLLRMGGAVSGFGALAFFVVLFSPWGNLAGVLMRSGSANGRQEREK
ncbi:hypothetical protein [Mesorhizobium sp. IMUNJ 23232]|uniref:hypothetical protein n=1 Tax=Mesorhizobium sp. IMUNJ 23232 TaxID=3376064 RepID=UPI00379B79C1